MGAIISRDALNAVGVKRGQSRQAAFPAGILQDGELGVGQLSSEHAQGGQVLLSLGRTKTGQFKLPPGVCLSNGIGRVVEGNDDSHDDSMAEQIRLGNLN